MNLEHQQRQQIQLKPVEIISAQSTIEPIGTIEQPGPIELIEPIQHIGPIEHIDDIEPIQPIEHIETTKTDSIILTTQGDKQPIKPTQQKEPLQPIMNDTKAIKPSQPEQTLQPTQEDYDDHDIQLKLSHGVIKSSNLIDIMHSVENLKLSNIVEQSEENLFADQKEAKTDRRQQQPLSQPTVAVQQMVEQTEQLHKTPTTQPIIHPAIIPQVFHQQHSYIKSLQQIHRILQDKHLSQQPFVNILLKNFTPFIQIPLSQENDEQIDLQDKEITSKIFDLEFLQKYSQNEQVQNLVRFNSIFHARVMFVLYRLTHADSEVSKELRFPLSQDLRQLRMEFLKLKLRVSFNHLLWTHKREFQSSYSSFKTTKFVQELQSKDQLNFGSLRQNDLFCRIQAFLNSIGFNQESHQFNTKMTHLSKESYKIRYIQEFAYYSFKTARQVDRFLTQNPQCNRFNNLKFYYNRQKASYKRLHIDDIHQQKATNYDWLQTTHDYIQWLFPNHFQSNFNGDSYALGYLEAEIFKTDEVVLEKLVKSFVIYLNFMGCRVMKEFEMITVELVQKKQNVQRLKECLIYNTHNHLRIMRILACLSVTGLRQYAQAFLQFLNSPILSKFIDYKRIQNPLQSQWNLYGSSSAQKKRKALEMCFIPYSQFPKVKESWKFIDRIRKSQEKRQQWGVMVEGKDKLVVKSENGEQSLEDSVMGKYWDDLMWILGSSSG